MAPRIKIIVNFKLILEPVCWNEWAIFRPASASLDHALVFVTSASIWVRSPATNAWARPVQAGRKVAHSFQQTRSKVSLKLTVSFKVSLVAYSSYDNPPPHTHTHTQTHLGQIWVPDVTVPNKNIHIYTFYIKYSVFQLEQLEQRNCITMKLPRPLSLEYPIWARVVLAPPYTTLKLVANVLSCSFNSCSWA